MTVDTFFALGILAGIMIAAWAISRKYRKSMEYDEMQLKIRARGYQIGFFTALALLVFLILFSELGLFTVATPAFGAFAVLIVSVVTFAVYCILHDAFLAVRGNSRSYIVLFAVVTVLNGAGTIRHLIEGNLLEDGKLTLSTGSGLMVFAGFTVVLVTLIIKTIRNRKEAEE